MQYLFPKTGRLPIRDWKPVHCAWAFLQIEAKALHGAMPPMNALVRQEWCGIRLCLSSVSDSAFMQEQINISFSAMWKKELLHMIKKHPILNK
jgi:hypothetical protein